MKLIHILLYDGIEITRVRMPIDFAKSRNEEFKEGSISMRWEIEEKPERKLKYCFDIDGVICTQDKKNYNWYWKAEPIRKAINEINRLYDQGHFILLYTARGSSSKIDWENFTKEQMDKWGVKHHKLILRKPSYDIIVDDKAMNSVDWMRKIEC